MNENDLQRILQKFQEEVDYNTSVGLLIGRREQIHIDNLQISEELKKNKEFKSALQKMGLDIVGTSKNETQFVITDHNAFENTMTAMKKDKDNNVVNMLQNIIKDSKKLESTDSTLIAKDNTDVKKDSITQVQNIEEKMTPAETEALLKKYSVKSEQNNAKIDFSKYTADVHAKTGGDGKAFVYGKTSHALYQNLQEEKKKGNLTQEQEKVLEKFQKFEDIYSKDDKLQGKKREEYFSKYKKDLIVNADLSKELYEKVKIPLVENSPGNIAFGLNEGQSTQEKVAKQTQKEQNYIKGEKREIKHEVKHEDKKNEKAAEKKEEKKAEKKDEKPNEKQVEKLSGKTASQLNLNEFKIEENTSISFYSPDLNQSPIINVTQKIKEEQEEKTRRQLASIHSPTYNINKKG